MAAPINRPTTGRLPTKKTYSIVYQHIIATGNKQPDRGVIRPKPQLSNEPLKHRPARSADWHGGGVCVIVRASSNPQYTMRDRDMQGY